MQTYIHTYIPSSNESNESTAPTAPSFAPVIGTLPPITPGGFKSNCIVSSELAGNDRILSKYHIARNRPYLF